MMKDPDERENVPACDEGRAGHARDLRLLL